MKVCDEDFASGVWPTGEVLIAVTPGVGMGGLFEIGGDFVGGWGGSWATSTTWDWSFHIYAPHPRTTLHHTCHTASLSPIVTPFPWHPQSCSLTVLTLVRSQNALVEFSTIPNCCSHTYTLP